MADFKLQAPAISLAPQKRIICTMPESLEKPDGPTLEDLKRHSDASFARRALANYLLPRNYEASIGRNKLMGATLLKKLFMSPAARFDRKMNQGFGSNYSLRAKGNPLDNSMDFALKVSVYNEAAHGLYFLSYSPFFVQRFADQGLEAFKSPVEIGLTALFLLQPSLVSLQRYNRARILGFVDRSLRRGREFSPEYRNWAGIDGQAQESYKQDSDEQPAAESLMEQDCLRLPQP